METQTVTDERAAWLEERKKGVGASEAAALFNCHPYLSVYSLWAQKCGLIEQSEASEAAEWGLALQPVIAREWARKRGFLLAPEDPYRIVRHPQSVLQATLDNVVLPWRTDDGVAMAEVVEIKTAGPSKDEEWENGAPIAYQMQAQAQMACTGYQRGHLVCLIAGQRMVSVEVERNDEFITTLLQRVEEFWKLVTDRTPPGVDDSEATLRALKLLYPTDSGERIDLTEEDAAIVDRWDALRKTANAAYADAKGYENRLRARMGSATYGLLPDGRRLSLKAQTRSAHEVRESTFRKLHLSKGGR